MVTDYGHDLEFGAFLTPAGCDPHRVVGLTEHAERLGLDLVTFQDHPYLARFLDTWTLLSYVAAATSRVRLAPCVLNLPLRPPGVVAQAATSLDLLSGGRFELGLGAGARAFWDAVAALGGPRRTPGESVTATAEAIKVIRAIWATGSDDKAYVDGRHYRLAGAQRGPAPAHEIGIWLGAYRPRMLRLTGRAADGWVPSSDYLPPERLAVANAVIDESAKLSGREPQHIRRLYNISGRIERSSEGFLRGPVQQWVDELSRLALVQGMSTFLLGSDDPQLLTRFALDVAPAVRETVADARAA